MTDSDLVLASQSNGVLTLTLNRPQKRNALTLAMREQLATALRRVSDDVGAIVLTGSDPAFCAGVDLFEQRELGGIRRRAQPPTEVIVSCSVPVIAAVNGPCWTGGLEMVLACDLVIASDRAAFGDTHAQLGLVPGWGGTERLSIAIGERRAAQLLLTGEPVDAPTALAWGLANEVVPHQQLLARAQELAARIAAAPRPSAALMTRLLRDSPGLDLAARFDREASLRADYTMDSAAAISRFAGRLGKRVGTGA